MLDFDEFQGNVDLFSALNLAVTTLEKRNFKSNFTSILIITNEIFDIQNYSS